MPRRRKNDPTYRPYDPEFHPKDLIERMSNGELNVQVAAAWNVSKDTLDRWRHEHDELEEAYRKGLTNYEAWFIVNRFNPMIEGKLEGRHAFNSCIAIANNKLGWSRGQGQSQITQNTQINITSNQLNRSMSVEDLTNSLNKDLEYLQLTGVIPQIENQTLDAEYSEDDDASEPNE